MTDVIVAGRPETIASAVELDDPAIAGMVPAHVVGAVTYTFAAGGRIHAIVVETHAGELCGVYWDRGTQQFATLPIDRSMYHASAQLPMYPIILSGGTAVAAAPSDELAVRVGALELAAARREAELRACVARVDEVVARHLDLARVVDEERRYRVAGELRVIDAKSTESG